MARRKKNKENLSILPGIPSPGYGMDVNPPFGYDRSPWHQPQINPYQVPQPVPNQQGGELIQSNYLFNNYYIKFTVNWWRSALDRAIQYSDLTYIDTLYSWCLQSSPFLMSLFNKRLLPAASRTIAVARPNGEIWDRITTAFNDTMWFKRLKTAPVSGEFYGVQVLGIDPVRDTATTYPIRNIDMFNEALREITLNYTSIANVRDYDNLFYFQPEEDQDRKLGIMQQISRALISTIKAMNDWAQANEQYAYPTKTVYYANNNNDAKEIAIQYAKNPSPGMIPVAPMNEALATDGKKNIYQFEIVPTNTQMYPESFRSYKELNDKYESHIMQLVLGGTLMGSTEKNTNSEQLAQTHRELYDNILKSDAAIQVEQLNRRGNMEKLSRLFGIPELAMCRFVEVPDRKISLTTFKAATDAAAKMGMRMSPSFFEKIGLEASDVDTEWNAANWMTDEQRTEPENNGLFGFFKKEKDADPQ